MPDNVVLIGDVLAAVLSGKRMQKKYMNIRCEYVSTIPFRDLVELYLYVSGVRNWRWVDSEGNFSERALLWKVAANLMRDMLRWPVFYLLRLQEVNRLLGRQNPRVVLSDLPSLLYLRTDHWFNINSGGSVGHIQGVIHGLQALGYHANVVSTDELAGIEKDDRFHLCRPDYNLGRNLPGFPEMLYNEQLLSYLQEKWNLLTPSFLYQRYSLGNYTAVLLKQRYGIPFVCEYNGPLAWVARNWDRRKLFHEKMMIRIELLNLRAADLVVVVSKQLRNELIARGIEAERILVNPNGVDVERYNPDVDSSQVKKRYDLENSVVIGFIGTFGKWHGAEVLAEAFGRLLAAFPECRQQVRLLMIGDGVTMPEVRKRLAQYDVSGSCVLTGLLSQDEGPAHLAACDILVSPHVRNPDGTPFFGSPTKLFEYMAMGKGIVASNLEQIGEVLVHDRTAWMVKPGDAASLRDGLKTLIDDRNLRERLGRSARQEVVAKYTWQEHTGKIIKRLRGLKGHTLRPGDRNG